MLKAADALTDAGHAVRVVSAQFTPWATQADVEVRRRRAKKWQWTVVNYDRRTARRVYVASGVRFRATRRVASMVGPIRCPMPLVVRAYSRLYPELLRAALAEPADLFYGGTTGALAVIAAAARRRNVPYGLDLEDFHSAEHDDSPAVQFVHALTRRIEQDTLSTAQFVTAGSAAIACAYAEVYGIRPIPINNTFSLPTTPPSLTVNPKSGLRLYWFSQTIGPGRGLEDVVRAVGVAGIPGELHVRGNPLPGYLGDLRTLATQTAPQLQLIPHHPAPPDEMIALCGDYDVGLAVERLKPLNRALCLTNKVFTYMLAGLAVACTDTPGQRPLAHDLGEGAYSYTPGDIATLAAGLKRWADDKTLLARAKAAAWRAAQRRWHWEHALERGALLDAVKGALHE
jgi:hypothetical protein